MPAVEAAAADHAGSILRALVPPVVRARAEVRQHNAAARRGYEDLLSWVTDEDHALEIELRRTDAELNTRNLFFSGERGYQRRERKRLQLQRLRDRMRSTARRVDDMQLTEGLWHRLWRNAIWPPKARLPWPLNPFYTEIEEIVACWRTPEPGGDGLVAIEEPRWRRLRHPGTRRRSRSDLNYPSAYRAHVVQPDISPPSAAFATSRRTLRTTAARSSSGSASSP